MEDVMQVEDHIVEAIVAELKRQSAEPHQGLSIEVGKPPFVRIEGEVDLDALAMVVMGSLAGGP
jgi:hypothetical protein